MENIPPKRVIITELSGHTPENKLTNDMLEENFREASLPGIAENLELDQRTYYGSIQKDRNEKGIDDPIAHRTGGIISRNVVGDSDERTNSMAIQAGRDLFNRLGRKKIEQLKKKSLTVHGATISPENLWPGLYADFMRTLNITRENNWTGKMAGQDTMAACTSWILSVQSARADLLLHGFVNAFVISSDIMSKLVSKYDKSSGIFGDGATALHIELETNESKGFAINNVDKKTIPQDKNSVRFPTNLAVDVDDENQRNRMNLKGKEVYEAGVGMTSEFILEYLEDNHLHIDDFDYIIPHQANGNMISDIAKNLNTGINRYGNEKMLSNIEYTGNTASSSIPLCLYDFQEKNHFKNGDRILMCSFAAGYTMGILDVEYRE